MNPTLFHHFDSSRPVFVKVDGVHLAGKIRKSGEYFDWQRFGVPILTMTILFNQGFLHHNEELEGDKQKEVALKELEEMDIAELHIYIDALNAKLKPKLKTAKEFALKKCAKVPKDCEMQVRKIKNWRLTYGHLLD